jgi:hypothetical protein
MSNKTEMKLKQNFVSTNAVGVSHGSAAGACELRALGQMANAAAR